MFDPKTRAFLPEWKRMKDAQWERIQAMGIPHLQLVKSGERQHQRMLVCSVDDSQEQPGSGFYEGVLIGQFKQAIDLSDEEIAQVVERWAAGRSAIDLPFVPCVWGRDGRPRTNHKSG
jgi:hypothetical protein